MENYIRFISDSFFLRILLETLGMGMIVAAVSLLIGYPLAYGMARAGPRLKKIYYIIILMPLLTSAVTRTYGWMVLLSRQGPLSKLLQSIGLIDKPLDVLYSFTAVIIGAIGIFLPFMILSLSGIIENILHSNVCDASKSLGAGPVRTFFSVVFPLSRPGIAAGTILAFVLSMATFVIPSLLGGASVKVIATQIFQEGVFLLNWPFAAVMAFILLITAGSIISIYFKLMTRKHAAWGRAE